MKHKPTNKLSRTQSCARGDHLPRNAYPSTRASQARTPAAHRQPSQGIQHRTTITFLRELNAAIENWRMLQPGRPTARSRDRGVGRRLVVRHDPTTQDAPTETDTAGGVPVDRENAPAPDARGAMGLPESKVGSINDRFITDR